MRANFIFALQNRRQIHRLVLSQKHRVVAQLKLLGISLNELLYGHLALASASLEHLQAKLQGRDAGNLRQEISLLAVHIGGRG